MWFFKPKPLISSEDEEWQLATVRWLLQNFKDQGALAAPRLITPSVDYFPDVCESPMDVVTKTFERVLGYAEMSGWPCVLEPQEYDADPHVGHTLLVQGAPSGPAGTFRVDAENRAIISFNPELVNDVQALVATFAHELAHYRLATFKTQPPGGEANEEFATDLAAVFMGFGIFLVNTAFQFNQYVNVDTGTLGWKSRRQGYLSQPELVHALGTFMLFNKFNVKDPELHLKDVWVSEYRKAVRYLEYRAVATELAT